MEPQIYTNTSPWNTGIKYGVFVGIAGIAFSLLALVIPALLSFILTLASIGVTIGILYKGLVYYRDKELGGAISFGQGFGFGMIVGLIGSIFKAITVYLVTRFANGDLNEEIINQQMEGMEDSGLDEETMNMVFNLMESFTSPMGLSIFSFVTYIFWGLIVSLILAAIVKKEHPVVF